MQCSYINVCFRYMVINFDVSIQKNLIGFDVVQVSLSPAGLIRCLAIGPNGQWIAVGQSSGFLTILDIRTGLVIASWKGHEGEVRLALGDSYRFLIFS